MRPPQIFLIWMLHQFENFRLRPPPRQYSDQVATLATQIRGGLENKWGLGRFPFSHFLGPREVGGFGGLKN